MTPRVFDDGHDDVARGALLALLARYRREGLSGLRSHAAEVVDEHLTERLEGVDEVIALLVEAVLTIAEATSPAPARRRDFEAFDAAEAAAEAERERGR